LTKEAVRMIELRAFQKLRRQASPQKLKSQASPETSKRTDGSGRKRRRRRGGTLVWPENKLSRRRKRAATGIQPPAREPGGAEQKAVPDGVPFAARRRRKSSYLKGCSPNL
jgi:hypothetical protein